LANWIKLQENNGFTCKFVACFLFGTKKDIELLQNLEVKKNKLFILNAYDINEVATVIFSNKEIH